MLFPCICFPTKSSLLRKMLIDKPQLLFSSEWKIKISKVTYKYVLILCWQPNQYVHFNQYFILRDSPYLWLYEINICCYTFWLLTEKHRNDLYCNNKFHTVTVSFLFTAIIELLPILQSCILRSNASKKYFCDVVHR